MRFAGSPSPMAVAETAVVVVVMMVVMVVIMMAVVVVRSQQPQARDPPSTALVRFVF